MRRFASLLGVIALLLIFIGGLSITGSAQATESAGTRNEVIVTARHCADYATTVTKRHHLFFHKKVTVVDWEGCYADPSTIFYVEKGHNLVTNGGLSWRALVMGEAVPASSGVGKYLALTSDTTAPSAGSCAYLANAAAVTAADCALGTGEYTTVGLGRASSTFAYGGAATYTLDHTWNCSSCSGNVVAASGVYDRVYGTPKGVLIWWYKFASSVTLNGTDSVQVTWTITLT